MNVSIVSQRDPLSSAERIGWLKTSDFEGCKCPDGDFQKERERERERSQVSGAGKLDVNLNFNNRAAV